MLRISVCLGASWTRASTSSGSAPGMAPRIARASSGGLSTAAIKQTNAGPSIGPPIRSNPDSPDNRRATASTGAHLATATGILGRSISADVPRIIVRAPSKSVGSTQNSKTASGRRPSAKSDLATPASAYPRTFFLARGSRDQTAPETARYPGNSSGPPRPANSIRAAMHISLKQGVMW